MEQFLKTLDVWLSSSTERVCSHMGFSKGCPAESPTTINEFVTRQAHSNGLSSGWKTICLSNKVNKRFYPFYWSSLEECLLKVYSDPGLGRSVTPRSMVSRPRWCNPPTAPRMWKISRRSGGESSSQDAFAVEAETWECQVPITRADINSSSYTLKLGSSDIIWNSARHFFIRLHVHIFIHFRLHLSFSVAFSIVCSAVYQIVALQNCPQGSLTSQD